MSRTAVVRVVLGTMEMGKRMNFEESEKFLKKFQEYGHTELDTAYMYAGGADGGSTGGLTEEFMGKIDTVDGSNVATKANPGGGKTLSPNSVRHQLETSLRKLNTKSVDLFYLHWPCMEANIEETLSEVNNLYKEGKFKRFGLSNFISWQVAEVQQICIKQGFVRPSVYQGMYNCLTRMVETELLPCLRKYNMSFYCYNPLAGGLLTGKHKRDDQPENVIEAGRFAGKQWGQAYRDRFWREKYFDALDIIQSACVKEGVPVTAAALRWVTHHSALSGENNDAIIVGASGISHLVSNLDALNEGPLPLSIVEAIEQGHELTKGHGPNYFRNVAVRHAV
ncbi:hypothetical protein ACHWQZ_G001231 [Mnemiopsis leidyi]